MAELPRQRGGIWFIYGPPGCGKTSRLTYECQRAAEKYGNDSVVIASLTRAAAAEIAGRDTGIPPDAVGTLHRHCHQALKDQLGLTNDWGAETPQGIKAWNEAHPHKAISRGVNQLEDVVDGAGGEGAGDDVHHQVMTLRAAMIPRERWTLQQRSHDADWERWKAKTGRLDYTDLIERVLAADTSHPFYPEVLLLDEAQDFSRLELELVRCWSRHAGTTVAVADPDQALYTWRGADPRALVAMASAGTRTLAQSHRVPVAVHAAARAWIRRIADRVDVDYHPTDQAGEVGESDVALRDGERAAELVATELDRTDGTVMVLASCAYMLTPLIAAVRNAGVPFHNPYRTNDGRWNPMRGAERLRAFLAADERVHGAEARCWTWDDLKRWTDPLSAKDALARGAKSFIESKCRADQYGETRAHDEAPLETVLELLGVTPGSMRHPALRGDVDWWLGAHRASERRKAEYPVRVLKQAGPGALSQEPRVVVGTCHSVKGGEADTVIVAPDLSAQGYWHGWRAGDEGADAVRRMYYVALTRARRRAVLLAPSGPENVHGELRDAVGALEAVAT